MGLAAVSHPSLDHPAVVLSVLGESTPTTFSCPVHLTLVRCVTRFRPDAPPFTLVSASTTARVAERQTRRT
jgi:hypothetical protein